ncbi:SDR family oxidoreductase [Micromonospora lupini]|uniref:SDR family oxidoreductase n=1 Tax=Micromonospora lupini TaxID=285679 RepID=UPI0033E37539
MPDLLDGRVAVVTGGGSGIGLSIASALAAAGADVIITSRSAGRLAKAELVVAEQTGRLCASMPCDVRDEAQVATLHDFVAQRFGPVSVVVNNAAANFRMPAERMTHQAMRTVVDTDLFGTFNVTREFLPDLVAAPGAAVLSIVVAAVERGFPQFSHAGAAKAGIISLTGSWAREWGRHGIRVNSIAPGPVPTEGASTNMLGMGDSSAAFAQFTELVPLGRLGAVDDIANAAVFLCSDAASWITGVNLTIDGGIYLPPGP